MGLEELTIGAPASRDDLADAAGSRAASVAGHRHARPDDCDPSSEHPAGDIGVRRAADAQRIAVDLRRVVNGTLDIKDRLRRRENSFEASPDTPAQGRGGARASESATVIGGPPRTCRLAPPVCCTGCCGRWRRRGHDQSGEGLDLGPGRRGCVLPGGRGWPGAIESRDRGTLLVADRGRAGATPRPAGRRLGWGIRDVNRTRGTRTATLSDRLAATFKNLRGKGRLSEADVDATVREIRTALLRRPMSRYPWCGSSVPVKERALGAEVSGAPEPAQQVVKMRQRGTVTILGGGETRRMRFAKRPPARHHAARPARRG